MRDKITNNHLITRLILLLNIIFITIMVIFSLIFNKMILSFNIPEDLAYTLYKIHILLFVFAFFLVLCNAYILIYHIFYSTKHYFKIAEKIEFNDLTTALGILNTLPTIDEYGDLGSRITKLLRVYLNYANVMKQRLGYKEKKLKIMIESFNLPILYFDYSIEQKTFHLSYVSKTAHNILEIENSSAIIGKTYNTLFTKDTIQSLQEHMLSVTKDSNNQFLNIPLTLEWLTSCVNKDSGIQNSIIYPLETQVIFFTFYFTDEYIYTNKKKNRANTNNIVDHFTILLHKKLDKIAIKE